MSLVALHPKTQAFLDQPAIAAFINGDWCATAGDLIAVHNPATGEELASDRAIQLHRFAEAM